jgi:hypothetical protein
MANTDVRLALWSGNNFSGRRVLLTRGGVAIRDMGALRFNDMLSSFRLRNVVSSSEVTLVLFSQTNFQGSFRVFRGNRSVSNLSQVDFNNRTSSLILVGRNLSDSAINRIRNTGVPPRDILIVRQ